MDKKIKFTHIDCACVIHGNTYDWIYVQRLYNMLKRNLSMEVRLHVYTEANRPVPAPMIKHALQDWGISGPRRAWWYKMQIFDPQHHVGPMLYFDLDTVIVGNIDWITNLSLNYFWAIRDFKCLWRPAHQGMNSSVMWWNTVDFEHVWQKFIQQDLKSVMKKYPGDQDFLSQIIDQNKLRFLPDQVKSWRWQCMDGGYDFQRRAHKQPGSGAKIAENDCILVFHGQPKPSQVKDKLVVQHWQ